MWKWKEKQKACVFCLWGCDSSQPGLRSAFLYQLQDMKQQTNCTGNFRLVTRTQSAECFLRSEQHRSCGDSNPRDALGSCGAHMLGGKDWLSRCIGPPQRYDSTHALSRSGWSVFSSAMAWLPSQWLEGRSCSEYWEPRSVSWLLDAFPRCPVAALSPLSEHRWDGIGLT